MVNNNQQQNKTESVYSTATLVYNQKGEDLRVLIDYHPTHCSCDDCGDFEQDGDLLIWECDACGGGHAKIVAEVFASEEVS